MEKESLEIRIENPNDYPKVYDVNLAAFKRPDEAQLVDKLRTGEAFVGDLSIVAAIGKDVIGHILFTPIQIVNGDIRHESLALAPMAVLPDHQGKEIGSQLVWAGLKKAKELGYKSVIVLGHETFYPRFNFTPANKWGIKAPFNIPEKYFMALELEEGALDNVSGTVEYPEALRM